jgi:phosphopantothenoylcysteine decarboxylase/phosphopantothenate--cysteine ligase
MIGEVKVLLGVTGSIAAYKAAELVRLMKARAWDVQVVMTRGAAEFVTELTFRTLSQHPVAMDMFEKRENWRPEHIALAEGTDVFVVAPCTANVIAKLAHGIADDLLTCTALSCAAPMVVAPAMNERMWDHPATQENVRILKARGVEIVEVGSGDLACGTLGRGRLAALEPILVAVERKLEGRKR